MRGPITRERVEEIRRNPPTVETPWDELKRTGKWYKVIPEVADLLDYIDQQAARLQDEDTVLENACELCRRVKAAP